MTGIGIYMILADCLQIPHMRTSRAVNSIAGKQQHKTGIIDVWLSGISGFIARHVHLNEFKRLRLASDLKTARMDVSPEMYTADAVVKALIVGLFAIPAYFVFPIMSPAVLLLAFILYRSNVKSVGMRIKAKRTRIENELPGFVFTIEKTLRHSRDVLGMIDTYALGAGDELKYELNITSADMRSGNYEAALSHLETRVGSSMMSDVCRGLVSIIRGDDTTAYWESLAMKFSEIQRQQLRLQAQKVPDKVKRLSMCLLGCFILIYIVVIATQIMSSVGVLFG